MNTPPRTMVALITPFNAGGSLDGSAHIHNLETLTARGLDGFLLAGSTGQGPYLEPGERAFLTATARGALGSAVFLLTGISAQSVRQAMTQVTEAADAGADAVLVTTPTLLLRGNHQLVGSFYRTVADRSPLPVFCYTVPAVTGYELPIQVAIDLAGHHNIAGMKDSGGDVDRIAPVLEGAGDGYLLFTGASKSVHAAVERGAYGAITASSNYASDLVTAARADVDAQEALTTVAGSVERLGLAGTYAAAELVGLAPGTMRAPLVALSAGEREELRTTCCPATDE
ncbi:MAG TPA: dihydrodipicolinate synthase family protein [Acidimicrobiia bacterium]|nr:dihydrodipicolinate synthase family protein [Acidimicrobiia bacterium]